MDAQQAHLIRRKLTGLIAYFYSARRLLDDARAYVVQVHDYLKASGEAGRKT